MAPTGVLGDIAAVGAAMEGDVESGMSVVIKVPEFVVSIDDNLVVEFWTVVVFDRVVSTVDTLVVVAGAESESVVSIVDTTVVVNEPQSS